jgi:hypothetical protein
MCLVNGLKPTVYEFKQLPQRNLNNLTIWHNVGTDVDNGIWAIAGARLGTYLTMLSEWRYKQVQDFSQLEAIFQTYCADKDPNEISTMFGMELRTQLDLPICTLDTEQSKFFKRHYNSDKHNLGPLVKEMDIIRQIEGW